MFAVFYRTGPGAPLSYYRAFATFEDAQAGATGATWTNLRTYQRFIVPLRAVALVTGQADVEDFRGEEVV